MEGDLAGWGLGSGSGRSGRRLPRAHAPTCRSPRVRALAAGLREGARASRGGGGGESPYTRAAEGKPPRGSGGRRAAVCSSGKTSVLGSLSFPLPLRRGASLREAGMGVGGTPLHRISPELRPVAARVSTKGTASKYP